ncbi:hypothetical protein HK102_013085, partial [Quaeritorhiza haematococci]
MATTSDPSSVTAAPLSAGAPQDLSQPQMSPPKVCIYYLRNTTYFWDTDAEDPAPLLESPSDEPQLATQ